MKPTPEELAAGLRALLRPLGRELASAEAQRDLRRAMYVLREARWNDVAFDLLDENDRLAEALDRIGRPAEDQARPRSYAEANARNLALRTAVCAFLDEAGNRSLEESAAIRSELVAILRRRP